jgi:hypothetical protein
MTNLEKLTNEAIGYASLKEAKEAKAVVVLNINEDGRVNSESSGDLALIAKLLLTCKKEIELSLKSTLSTLNKYDPAEYEELRPLIREEENASF